jgi:hypothetical protein
MVGGIEYSLWNPYGIHTGIHMETPLGDGGLIDFFLLFFAPQSMESVLIHTNFSYEIP